MKKVLCTILIGSMCICTIGCNEKKVSTDKNRIEQSEQEENNKNDNENISTVTNDTKENKKEDYYNAGEVVELKDERGTYTFTIKEANYLGAHQGDSNKNERVQIVWEVNNIDFFGKETDLNGNVIRENVVAINNTAIKVKDNENYILEEMSSGWEGDWSNQNIEVKPGEKAIQKYTWILNDPNTEYVLVSFPRLDKEFKVNINK